MLFLLEVGDENSAAARGLEKHDGGMFFIPQAESHRLRPAAGRRFQAVHLTLWGRLVLRPHF